MAGRLAVAAVCWGVAAAAAPRLELRGNGLPIADGYDSPELATHTDFGAVEVGGAPGFRVFAIRNTGTAELRLGGTPPVVVVGPEFAVTSVPATTLAPGGVTTFQIRFAPAELGPRRATVRIPSAAGGAYTFAVQGTGAWRSALYPADWDPLDTDPEGRFLHDFGYAGYHAGQMPIPDSPPGPVVDASQAPYHADPSGGRDSTAAIQRALDEVGQGGGGVVYLPAGTYLVSFPANQNFALRIRHPRTVLRGAGRDRTFIENTSTRIRGGNVILVRPDMGSVFTALPDTTRPLAADADNRASVIELDSVEGLAVGERIILRSDWTQDFIDEHGMTDIWRPTSGRTGPFFFRRLRAIDPVARTVTLDTPIRYPLKSRDHARLYICAPFLREVGIEDLAIGNRQHPAPGWSLRRGGAGWGDNEFGTAGTPAHDVHASHFVRFQHVWDGWMRRVDSFRPAGNPDLVHMLSNIAIILGSRQVTFADCVIGWSQYNGGGGNGYGFTFQDANDCLITGCEVVATRHNYDFKCAGANGNVVHRSISRAPRLASDFHMYLSMGNLLDCMLMDGDFLESSYRPWGSPGNLHGHAGTQNVFWNTYGTAARTDKVVDSRQFGHGYVIGTWGPTHRVVLDPIVRGIDTSPIDWSEGIGEGGAMLLPESLYEDQLARRASFLPRVQADAVQPSHDSATVPGFLSNRDGRATLFWGRTDGGTMPEAWERRLDLGPATVGPLVAELIGLAPASAYSCRWLVVGEEGEGWSDATVRFTTALGPAVRSAGVDLASTTAGTFRGELLGVAARLTLYWGTADGGTDPAAWEQAVGPVAQAVGEFAVGPVPLPPFRQLHYRWHAATEEFAGWSPASGTIDTTPVLAVADPTVGEGAGTARFALELSHPSAVEVRVAVATADGSAVAGRDYAAVARTLVIPAGETRAVVAVPIVDDEVIGDYIREFRLVLADPVHAVLERPYAVGTILDDDLPPLPVTEGLLLHLDASSLAGALADGAVARVWPDSSGRGQDATTDAGAPLWLARGIGGRPAFAFDGGTATFVTPVLRAATGPVSAYVVSEKTSADGGGWQRILAAASGGPNDWTAPNWSFNPPRGEDGSPLAYAARVDSLRLDGGRGAGPVRIGRQGTSASGWFLGRIGEVLVYGRELSDAEHARVETWLRAKYGISP